MEQEMNSARCPLVREIEEAEAVGIRGIITSPYWPRLRAALEAAEEMAEWITIYPDHPAYPEMERYRAATRGS